MWFILESLPALPQKAFNKDGDQWVRRLTVEDAGAVIASKRQEGISADRPGGLAIDERADFIDSLGISA